MVGGKTGKKKHVVAQAGTTVEGGFAQKMPSKRWGVDGGRKKIGNKGSDGH